MGLFKSEMSLKKSKSLRHRILLSFFLLGPLGNIYCQINRVEPPFWWIGMKNTELQLMVYGKNIKNLKYREVDRKYRKSIKKVQNNLPEGNRKVL